MADFQPRFVDLVRNYTTTVGTGDFKLGPAVNGYTGFTAACAVGDSFYYSAIGVDKPAEREVGRGTLLANGTIARGPISGARTSFTSGTKSIALIAAAEWFEATHEAVGRMSETGVALTSAPDAQAARTALGLGSAAIEPATRFSAAIADRAALADCAAGAPVHLGERGREGIFAWDPRDCSTAVAADKAQGIYVPPTGGDGSSGAWVRAFSGSVDARWFGLVEGDVSANGAANTAAMAALLATLDARRATFATTTSNGLERILIPSGIYWFADDGSGCAIDIKNAVIIEGHAAGYSASAPVLLFPAGVTGIRIQGPQTSGADRKDADVHNGATGTVIRNLALRGNFTKSEAEAHGIQVRTTCTLDNLIVDDFEGDGVHIAAYSGSPDGADPPFGNANTCMIQRLTASNCRDGLSINGSDTNAITVVQLNARKNRRWGINESSSIGNSYFGGQIDTNGIVAANDGVSIGASVVSYSANRYGVIAGQEAGASTNPPSGTTADNGWWYYIMAGGEAAGIPAWTSGMLCRAGGAVRVDEITGFNVFSGIYCEAGQGKTQISQRSLVIGGSLANWVYQSPAANRGTSVIRGIDSGVIELSPSLNVQSGSVAASLGSGTGNVSNYILRGTHPSVGAKSYALHFELGTLNVRFAYNALDTGTAFWVTGQNTTTQFGTGAAFLNAFAPAYLMVAGNSGAANSSSLNLARRMMIDAAAPTTGAHARGEVVFNRNAAAGSPVGWQCTAAGTPGTWVAMANL